jgi:hypothetical protein
MKKLILKTALLAAVLALTGAAQAAFEGRDTTGVASSTCTATGVGKCTYFFDTVLDITILNDWNLGKGTWSATAADGSAQALAASAGWAASGLKGWVLPTGDEDSLAGSQNQYLSIWNSAGGTFAALSDQFDGVQYGFYWSGSDYPPNEFRAWFFDTAAANQSPAVKYSTRYALAVLPYDIAAPIPEPETYALMLAGLALVGAAARRRQAK